MNNTPPSSFRPASPSSQNNHFSPSPSPLDRVWGAWLRNVEYHANESAESLAEFSNLADTIPQTAPFHDSVQKVIDLVKRIAREKTFHEELPGLAAEALGQLQQATIQRRSSTPGF